MYSLNYLENLYKQYTVKAMKHAYEDAIISHHYNGVYTAMHMAALTSMAYSYDDTRLLVEDSKNYIPQNTLTAYIYEKTMQAAQNHSDAVSAFSSLSSILARYHWVHALPNFSIILLSLYYCNNKFGEALYLCGALGLDVDSTAVEVGSVLGIMFPEQIH